ncbi:MAG: hypothetical protein QW046_03670, partial [Candidatus Micrarchaeaceae archaeon]
IINLIPSSDPYVLTQDNLPQLYWRFCDNSSSLSELFNNLMVTSFTDFSNNISGEYHYANTSHGAVNLRIDYVLADLGSGFYYWGSPNMAKITNIFYGSGSYGLVAEASNIVLLEKNYTGPLKYYNPIFEYINPDYFSTWTPVQWINNMITITNYTSKGFINPWKGPWDLALPPGTYKIDFKLMTTNISKNNKISLWISGYDPNFRYFNMTTITGQNFSGAYQWTNISMEIKIDNFTAGIMFQGIDPNWNGTLFFNGVTIKQIAPPSQKISNNTTNRTSQNINNSFIISNSNLFSQNSINFANVRIVYKNSNIFLWRYSNHIF